jgi:hypothetical protein
MFGEQENMTKLDLTDVEPLVDQLQACLLSNVDAGSLGVPSKIPYKFISLRELLIHRVADLGRNAADLYRSGSVTGPALLTRAIIETIALLFVLHRLEEKVVNRKSTAGIDDELMKLLFGSRQEAARVQATNIIGQVDKVDRKYSGIRKLYDILSEVAHPNHDGLLGAYGSVEQYELHLDRTYGREFSANLGVPGLYLALETAIELYNCMVSSFSEFKAICHASSTDGAEPERRP